MNLQAAEPSVKLICATGSLFGRSFFDERSRQVAGRKIALVVLTGTKKWSHVRLHLERVAAVVNAAIPGSYTEVEIPFDRQEF